MLILTFSVTSVASPALDAYNVVWTSPSENASGSMPIGNGDIGLNVWVEPSGDLLFYIGKTDAWSENGRLLKLGRVRVQLSPNPFTEDRTFNKTLSFRTGEIMIAGGKGNETTWLRVWVDANAPVIRVDVDSPAPVAVEAKLELWRTQPRELKDQEVHSAYSMSDGAPVIVEPDTILPAQDNMLRWYHRNERSTYGITLKNQHLESLLGKFPDPLIHRTFGAFIQGEGMIARDNTTLATEKPVQKTVLSIWPYTAQTDSVDAWLTQVEENIRAYNADLESARAAHQAWWQAFWDRSWVLIQGDEDANTVTSAYLQQRWINACGGRGAYPIKFNGSIFTFDTMETEIDGIKGYDADFRLWGETYWFQNTRLPYWSMLAAGDFDLIQPLFRMYRDALSFAEARTPMYYGHQGAFFPETMTFWGTYANSNFGWKNPEVNTVNTYIKYYWSGGLELCMMMLDFFEYTQDDAFAQNTLLPLAESITTFFDQHWKRGEDGKIRFDPAASLETWHTAVDPLPEIAGLNAVLTRLIALPQKLTTEEQRAAWQKTLSDMPAIPIKTEDGKTFLQPARTFDNLSNSENPELYAVFPYRIYGLLAPTDRNVGLETWNRRKVKRTGGWSQDAIQAAYLGLTRDAQQYVELNAKFPNCAADASKRYARFQGFWGKNFDWVPDQDHGGVTNTAIQRMLMQCEGVKILLLPAWPKNWDCDFKLCAPGNTTVEGQVRNGQVKSLKVIPQSREKDVVIQGN